tara:strand:- start:2997 stop:3380 length:384 start_codon:yes stop_codon:yes gene_type:complete
MQNWTDEELTSTRDKLEAWSERYNGSGWGPKLWLFTAFLGAFAISTGFAFIFFDGLTVLNVILMILGSITCYSWYRSDKQHKDNVAFLAEINKEISHRKKRNKKKESKTKHVADGKAEEKGQEETKK